MAVEGLSCREYQPADTADVLEVRNAIFPPLTAEERERKNPGNTASLAYRKGEPVGAIPLDQREFVLAPGVTVPVAFEHGVGVKEEYRSQGIGTAMIQAAREFMADRCDLLMVYRGAERSPGYRFYIKSGHQDLLYTRPVKWEPPADLSSQAERIDAETLYEHEDEILPIYNHAYASCGGHPPRQPGYWRQALGGMIYIVLPHEFFVYRYPAEGEIIAYGIFGIETSREPTWPMGILEIASSNGWAGAVEVMKAAAVEARKRNIAITDYVSVDHPYRQLYRRLGFGEEGRSFMIMGQVIAPQRLFRRVCRDLQALSDLKINVWTPTKDYVLFEGDNATREITLEGKDIFIERLLTRRLDIISAVQHNLLTIRNGSPEIAARLSEALPFAPWVYHHIDYT